jgi:WD40 repeat protein
MRVNSLWDWINPFFRCVLQATLPRFLFGLAWTILLTAVSHSQTSNSKITPLERDLAGVVGGDLHTNDWILWVEPPAVMRPRLSRIARILIDQCVGCHNAEQAEGGYSMATPQSMLSAGDSRRAPFRFQSVSEEQALAHSPDAPYGELYRRIASPDANERMPKDADSLDWDTIESIREWLAAGAPIDGAADAPIESFTTWKAPEQPQFASYPKPHAVGAIALHSSKKFVFISGFSEILVWSIDLEPRLVDRIPSRGRFISDIQWDGTRNTLYFASGEPGRIGFVESVSWPGPRDAALDLNGFEKDPHRWTHWVCRDVPLDIALSPSGDRIAIANGDGSVVVVDLDSNRMLWKSLSHAAAVTSVDWSDDGKTVLSSSRDRTAKSYSAEDGAILNSFVDHERTVASIQFIKGGVVSFDEAGVLRWFPNATTPNARASRGGFTQQTTKLLANRDFIIVPTADSLRRFQFRREEVVESKDEEGKEKKKTNFHIEDAKSLPLAPWGLKDRPIAMSLLHGDHEFIAAGFSDGQVLLWSVDSDQPVVFQNQPRIR